LPEPAAPAALSRRDAWLVAASVAVVLLVVIALAFLLEDSAQRGAITSGGTPAKGLKERREIDKLTAEVKQIRSDTSGSLFWLKLAGVFVTIGAAVGGYLVAQSRSSRERAEAEERQTRLRIDFETRTRVDSAFQAIVQELSAADASLLRATAAMKLGKLLQATPVEWNLDTARREELWSLSKQILAASLAIESDPKVLKALTIAAALHPEDQKHGNLRGLDFSLARAADAYWAKTDFTYADFYRAELTGASFREATLDKAQFRETILVNAVLADAICRETNFKLTDLRGADLSGADLTGAKFENARVHGVVLTGATVEDLEAHLVDLSPRGDGTEMQPVNSWASQAVAGRTKKPPNVAARLRAKLWDLAQS
jgi:uncharacterized protein YjbI with pentapeptide repeats